jgi:spoIIIJ-associated protein
MDYFEVEGRTVDEALDKICEENNLHRDELEYTVIDQKKRVLGLLGKESISIKAWVKQDENKEVLNILDRICVLAGLDCSVLEHKQEDHLLSVDISGEDLSIIIGKNGEVLDALQYLINKMVNRGEATPRRIVLDADGYRERKLSSLKRLAHRSAEQVRTNGKSTILNPMNAHDRRIIHLELKEDQEVFTKSLGDGPFKRIMIGSRKSPRDNRRNKRRI